MFAKTYFISLSHCHVGRVHSMSCIGAHRSPCVRFWLRSRGCAQVRTGGPRRAAQLARGCVCLPVDRRRRPGAGAALPSPAAAFVRLLPPAVACELAPRSLRPQQPLRVCCPPPSAPRRRRAPLARGCVSPSVSPPPSPPSWRRAPFARSCRCASAARRRGSRAGAALPSPAAASPRLLQGLMILPNL